MVDINQKEMELLYQWACDNHTEELEQKYFTRIDRKCESYYEKRDCQLEYAREYSFQTLSELKGELDAMWEDDTLMKQIEKAVLVASMKNKPSLQKEENLELAEEKMVRLEPFRYNF